MKSNFKFLSILSILFMHCGGINENVIGPTDLSINDSSQDQQIVTPDSSFVEISRQDTNRIEINSGDVPSDTTNTPEDSIDVFITKDEQSIDTIVLDDYNDVTNETELDTTDSLVDDVIPETLNEDVPFVCENNLTNCNGSCVNVLISNNTNCGACGNACFGHSCQSNGNVFGCQCGTTGDSPPRMIYSCYGQCGIFLDIDSNNCGTCGHVCLNNTVCINGSCV
jgi:hypothetical protein